MWIVGLGMHHMSAVLAKCSARRARVNKWARSTARMGFQVNWNSGNERLVGVVVHIHGDFGCWARTMRNQVIRAHLKCGRNPFFRRPKLTDNNEPVQTVFCGGGRNSIERTQLDINAFRAWHKCGNVIMLFITSDFPPMPTSGTVLRAHIAVMNIMACCR